MDHELQWNQTCKKFCFGQTEIHRAIVAFSSQSCPEVRLLILAATATEHQICGMSLLPRNCSWLPFVVTK